jgi:hypothetical protein
MEPQYAVVKVGYVLGKVVSIGVVRVFDGDEAEGSARHYVRSNLEIPKDVDNRTEFLLCEVMDEEVFTSSARPDTASSTRLRVVRNNPNSEVDQILHARAASR